MRLYPSVDDLVVDSAFATRIGARSDFYLRFVCELLAEPHVFVAVEQSLEFEVGVVLQLATHRVDDPTVVVYRPIHVVSVIVQDHRGVRLV